MDEEPSYSSFIVTIPVEVQVREHGLVFLLNGNFVANFSSGPNREYWLKQYLGIELGQQIWNSYTNDKGLGA